eukprot:1186347-Prorocentrum_minimum.AAC.5
MGARYGYILSPLLRWVPATGIFSLPFCDGCPLRVYSLSPSAIGARYEGNIAGGAYWGQAPDRRGPLPRISSAASDVSEPERDCAGVYGDGLGTSVDDQAVGLCQ